MSCLTTSPTRRSRIVPAAVLIASAAASSHDVLLVPMTSVTLYTLMTFSFGGCQPGRCQERVHVRPGAAAARRALLPPGLSLALRSGAVQTGAPARSAPLGSHPGGVLRVSPYCPGSSHGSGRYLRTSSG